MMQKRMYVITTGSYSSYRILCHVQGNKTPALSTLWKRFETRYEIFVRDTWIPSAAGIFNDMDRELKSQKDAIERLKTEGYEGREYSDLAGYFVDWLVKDHNFEEINIMELNCD
jgi:hypothetical protein